MNGRQRLANTIATGAALVAFILAFGPVSGAHFNPVVTLCDWWAGGVSRSDAVGYVAVQFIGGLVGVSAAHAMFGEDWLTMSPHVRSGGAQLLSEGIATFGLLCVIWGVTRSHSRAGAFAVGAYITAAYWFTSSTSFANPAVTVARAFTPTFSGIRPIDVPGFIVAQVMGGFAATALFLWMLPISPSNRRAGIVERDEMSK